MATPRRQRGIDALKPYTPGLPIEDVQLQYGLTDVIKLASNENPLGPSPKVLDALQRALSEISRYPDARGKALCRAIADHLGVGPAEVVIGNGADGIIRTICMAFLEDGDEVVLSRSSFPVYESNAVIMRARVVQVSLNQALGLDLDAMAKAVTDRTKLIFVCNPNNPTGAIVTAGQVEAFVARIPPHALVVFDEAYFEFAESPDFPETVRYIRAGRPNVMVLRTFSKIYGIAGIRLGYGVGVREVVGPVEAAGESFPVNRLAQIAGLAALEDREFLDRTLAVNRAGRLFLYREFDRLGLEYIGSHTNFVLVRIGAKARAVFVSLLQQGVIVRPCVSYELPDFLRVTVGTEAQNQRFIQCLETALAQPQMRSR